MGRYAKAIWGPETTFGQILRVLSAGLTAAAVYAVPNDKAAQ